MRLIRTLVLAALTALCAGAYGVPSMLIVQLKEKGSLPLDAGICDSVANELQAGGRVQPIVWGNTDPIYREAVQAGKIPAGQAFPTLSQAEQVASTLNAEYVLAVDMRGSDSDLLGAATLYQRGHLIWKDPDVDLAPALAHLREMLKKKQITKDQYDSSVLKASFRTVAVQFNAKFGLSDAVRSLARTWVEMMNSGPLLKLGKAPEKQTPPPAQGQNPTVPDNPAAAQPDKTWMTNFAAALKAGDVNKAISVLRDAVDGAPMDVERRLVLVKTLMQFGQPDVAAREARRAAELMPDQLQFRSLAARSWMLAGNPEEAQTDLNEAVTRAPDSPETRLLLAEVALDKDDSAAAIDHLDKAISAGAGGDAYYLRGLAHAMAGDTEPARADLDKASQVGLSQDPMEAEARYSLVAAFFDDGVTSLGNEIRELHQRAQVHRTDKDVKSDFDDLDKRVSGRSQFIAAVPVPLLHATSHNRRVLAYKLLSQCLTDLDSYLKSGDADVLTDSRIDLGEALKQGAIARQAFKDEQQGTKSNAKPG